MPIYFAWFTMALLSVGADARDQNLPQSGRLLYCVRRGFIDTYPSERCQLHKTDSIPKFSNTYAVQYHRVTQAVRDDRCALGVRLLVPLRGRQGRSVGSSSDENRSVVKQGCGVRLPRCSHAAGGRKSSGSWIVKLSGCKRPCSVVSSGHENSPVFEQCGRLKGAWGFHVALRRRKGLAGKIEQLRSCDGIPVVFQEASRHE